MPHAAQVGASAIFIGSMELLIGFRCADDALAREKNKNTPETAEPLPTAGGEAKPKQTVIVNVRLREEETRKNLLKAEESKKKEESQTEPKELSHLGNTMKSISTFWTNATSGP